MEHRALLRCVHSAPAGDTAASERLDREIGERLPLSSALELARDAEGSLLAFPDAASAARFALSLREASGSLAAFAIETGPFSLERSPTRPTRVSGPALVVVEGLIDLALKGQILMREAVLAELAREPDLRGASLGDIELEGESITLCELECTGEPTFVIPPARDKWVGREAELSSLEEWLARGVRGITIVGPVGVGKTALALEAARRNPERKTAFVELGSADSADDAVRALGRVLSIPASEPDPEARLLRVIEALGRGVLDVVILDGVDGLPDASGFVTALRVPSSTISFLCTSREPLGLDDERVLRLAPLPLADAEELFLDRRGKGRLPDEDLARVVGSLDGLPLAIELTARSGERNAPLVDRGLERALAASHSALTEDERHALGLVAISPEGLSARHVGALSVARSSLPDALARLTSKSMLEPRPNRHQTLHCVRRFVLRALSKQAHEELMTELAEVLVPAAETWAEGANRDTPKLSLDLLADEQENLEAIHYGLARARPDLSVRAILALDPLFTARGPRDLHLDLLQSAHDIVRDEDPGLAREILLVRVTALANTYGDVPAAERALRLLDTTALAGTRLARHLWLIGVCQFANGRNEEAERTLLDASAACRAADDLSSECRVATTLGNVLAQVGRFPEAESWYQRALAGHERLGELRRGAVVAQNLARLASEGGQKARAADLHERALQLSEELGDARTEALGCSQSALGAHDRGDFDTAERRYERAVELCVRTGEWRFRGFTQVLHAFLALERGQLSQARDLIGSCAPRDPLTEGLRFAAVAALSASAGELSEASESFSRSQQLLARDPHLRAAVHVLEGLVDVARAQALAREGKALDAEALRSSARARMASVSLPQPVGSTPAERSCLVRIALRLVSASLGDPPALEEARALLEVAEDAWWFRRPGERRVDLSRRVPLRRLFQHLVQKRRDSPSFPSDAEELIAVAWPDERIERRAALNRLYVAVATLRRCGLGDALITRQDGYMLDPNLPLVFRARG